MCQDKTQTFSVEENSFPRFGLGRRMEIRPRGDISLLVIFTLSGAAGRYDIVINSVPGFAVRDCILRVVLNQGCGNRNALMPRGHFLFRSAGKGSKRGRFCTALRQPFASFSCQKTRECSRVQRNLALSSLHDHAFRPHRSKKRFKRLTFG